MPAYLISGPSGAGKSTVGKYLTERGHKVIETDHEPGLSGFYNKESNEKIESYAFPLSKEQLSSYAWNWDKEVMSQLFARYKNQVVFFVGGAHNEAEFFDKFKTRFALCTSNDVLKTRLQVREPHRWADGTAELNNTIEWNTKFRDYSIKNGSTIIDSSQLPEIVTNDILSELKKAEVDLLRSKN